MKLTDEALLQQLSDTIAGLTFISETDAMWETIVWPGPDVPTPNTVRDWQATPATPAAYDDFARLLRGPTTQHIGLDAAGIARVQRYRKLKALLEEHLEELRVIRVGNVKLTIYVLGHSPAGNWLGLKTYATET